MRQFILHFWDRNEDLDITEFNNELNALLTKHRMIGDFSEMINPFWRETKTDNSYG